MMMSFVSGKDGTQVWRGICEHKCVRRVQCGAPTITNAEMRREEDEDIIFVAWKFPNGYAERIREGSKKDIYADLSLGEKYRKFEELANMSREKDVEYRSWTKELRLSLWVYVGDLRRKIVSKLTKKDLETSTGVRSIGIASPVKRDELLKIAGREGISGSATVKLQVQIDAFTDLGVRCGNSTSDPFEFDARPPATKKNETTANTDCLVA